MKATHPADNLIAQMENTERAHRFGYNKLTAKPAGEGDMTLHSDSKKKSDAEMAGSLAYITADGRVFFYCHVFEAASGPFCFNIYDHQGFIIG